MNSVLRISSVSPAGTLRTYRIRVNVFYTGQDPAMTYVISNVLQQSSVDSTTMIPEVWLVMVMVKREPATDSIVTDHSRLMHADDTNTSSVVSET